jgi:hypothetical protein
MKKALDLNGQEIGLFDGNLIKDNQGNVVYWIADDEVFAPMTYANGNLQPFNKGQSQPIGQFIDGQCLAGDELIFRIENW